LYPLRIPEKLAKARATLPPMSILFLLGLFVLHLRHLLGETSREFSVLDIVDRERPKHIVRVLPGPILVRIGIGHFGRSSLCIFVMKRIRSRWIHVFGRATLASLD